MSERADCCPYLGRVLVQKDRGPEFGDDLELLFCGHHYRKHEVRLLMDGWKIKTSTDEWSTSGT